MSHGILRNRLQHNKVQAMSSASLPDTALLQTALALFDYQTVAYAHLDDDRNVPFVLHFGELEMCPQYVIVGFANLADRLRFIGALCDRNLHGEDDDDHDNANRTVIYRLSRRFHAYVGDEKTSEPHCEIGGQLAEMKPVTVEGDIQRLINDFSSSNSEHVFVKVWSPNGISGVIIDPGAKPGEETRWFGPSSPAVPLLLFKFSAREYESTEDNFKRHLEYALVHCGDQAKVAAKRAILVVLGLEQVMTYLRVRHLDAFLSMARLVGFDPTRVVFMSLVRDNDSELVERLGVHNNTSSRYQFGVEKVRKVIESDVAAWMSRRLPTLSPLVDSHLRHMAKLNETRVDDCPEVAPASYHRQMLDDYVVLLCDIIAAAADNSRFRMEAALRSNWSLLSTSSMPSRVADDLLTSVRFNFKEEKLHYDLHGSAAELKYLLTEMELSRNQAGTKSSLFARSDQYLSGREAVTRLLGLIGFCLLDKFPSMDFTPSEMVVLGEGPDRRFSCAKAVREMVLQRRPDVDLLLDIVKWCVWLYTRQAGLLSERLRRICRADLADAFPKVIDALDAAVAHRYQQLFEDELSEVRDRIEQIVRFRFEIVRFDELASTMHLLGFSCFKPLQPNSSTALVPARTNAGTNNNGKLSISVNVADQPFEAFSLESTSGSSFHENFFSVRASSDDDVMFSDITRAQVGKFGEMLNNAAETFARFKYGLVIGDISALIEHELESIASDAGLAFELRQSVLVGLEETLNEFAERMHQSERNHVERERLDVLKNRAILMRFFIELARKVGQHGSEHSDTRHAVLQLSKLDAEVSRLLENKEIS